MVQLRRKPPSCSAACGFRPPSFMLRPMEETSMKDAARCIPKHLGKAVAASDGKFDLGVTFDGDADRALFCDGTARL